MNIADIVAEAKILKRRSEDLLREALRVPKKRIPVSIQRSSADSKLAPQREVMVKGRKRNVPLGPYVTSTYVSIRGTCPDSCAYKGGGCYASSGMAHLTMASLDSGSEGWDSLEITLAEARAIDRLWPNGIPQDGHWGGRDLRIHVGGEVSCARGASALGEASVRWRERQGGDVWTYTHRWKQIPRSCWGTSISVLASCENENSAQLAHESGYAVAVTVERFPDDGRPFQYGHFVAIPCPAEVRETTCNSCRLCLDDERLRKKGLAIAFALHGPQKLVAIDRLRRSSGQSR